MNKDLIIAGAIMVAAGWYIYHNDNPITIDKKRGNDEEPEIVTDNQVWSQYVYAGSVDQGYHPELASRALRKFNNGLYLNGEEYSYIRSATDLFGFPDYQPPDPQNRPFTGLQSTTTSQAVNNYAYPG